MLQIAVQLDPDYSDAMAYMNLLYRITAAIADTPEQYADQIAKADHWVDEALAAKRRLAQTPRPPAQSTDMDPPTPPPPPPPPPPPGGGNLAGGAAPSQGIRIEGSIQQVKLVKQPAPVYPPQARADGISGVVRLSVLIAKDGTVRNIEVVSGHPLLAAAAIDAVRQWVHSPTLLNGEAVEVATSVDVNFSLSGQ
jgi:TonB family protein